MPTCIRCNKKLECPGAIVIGPDNCGNTSIFRVDKIHICVNCYSALERWLTTNNEVFDDEKVMNEINPLGQW